MITSEVIELFKQGESCPIDGVILPPLDGLDAKFTHLLASEIVGGFLVDLSAALGNKGISQAQFDAEVAAAVDRIKVRIRSAMCESWEIGRNHGTR